ncbi:hypothetical protein DFH09DRAFT_1310485 [Mycena vulgaris]|nr:hypothetical protein DFH09DRAFT_1310485 [Mycena vulgaris]
MHISKLSPYDTSRHISNHSFRTSEIVGRIVYLSIGGGGAVENIWFGQASNIFKCLQVTDNYEDYHVVLAVSFWLQIGTPEESDDSFLFVCPFAYLRVDSDGRFVLPECAAKWSLHPAGASSLTPEEAMTRGLPPLMFNVGIKTISMTRRGYEEVRLFHQAKGFDPDSQDIARTFGHPLLKLFDDSTAVIHTQGAVLERDRVTEGSPGGDDSTTEHEARSQFAPNGILSQDYCARGNLLGIGLLALLMAALYF